MTIVVAWLRTVGQHPELVVASDSRLRGGEAWDAAPKVFPLSRGDSAVAFAGSTASAYPLLLQLLASIEHYPKANNRAQDFYRMKAHALDLINYMWAQKKDLPPGEDADLPHARFLLAGYSWQLHRFVLGHVVFNKQLKQFQWHRKSGDITVLGDPPELEAEFRSQLRICRHRGLRGLPSWKRRRSRSSAPWPAWDMEPLRILAGFCDSTPTANVGGPPQVLKIYEHMNSMPYAVYWPTRESGRLALFGRPMLPYEQTTYLAIDPWSGETHKRWDYLAPSGHAAESGPIEQLSDVLRSVLELKQRSQASDTQSDPMEQQ